MGWRERDYAKFTDAEWKALLGPSAPTAPARRRRRSPVRFITAAAICVSLALTLLGQFPRGNPVLPQMGLPLPSLSRFGIGGHDESRTFRMSLERVSALHATMTITGRSSGIAGELLRLEGHSGARPWHTLALATAGSDDAYAFTFKLSQPGMLNLRIVFPNGDRVIGSTRVVRRDRHGSG